LSCLGCGKRQDRDRNAAANIENVGVGRTHDAKRTGRACKTEIPAVLDEPSILPEMA
jgi:putative transposase